MVQKASRRLVVELNSCHQSPQTVAPIFRVKRTQPLPEAIAQPGAASMTSPKTTRSPLLDITLGCTRFRAADTKPYPRALIRVKDAETAQSDPIGTTIMQLGILRPTSSFMIVATSFCLAGCATKTLGRLPPLKEEQAISMDCETLNREVYATRAFSADIERRSQFSKEDALSILIDLGIGNLVERRKARSSVEEKLVVLEHAKAVNRCPDAKG